MVSLCLSRITIIATNRITKTTVNIPNSWSDERERAAVVVEVTVSVIVVGGRGVVTVVVSVTVAPGKICILTVDGHDATTVPLDCAITYALTSKVKMPLTCGAVNVLVTLTRVLAYDA